MEKNNISSYALIEKHGINANTFQRIRNNEGITLYTLEKLCKILNCTPNDIVEFIDSMDD